MTPAAQQVDPLDFRVPADLSELDQWVLWCYEARQGKPTKVPYTVRGYRASTTEPHDWAPFDEALDMWMRVVGRYNGIGFVFAKTDPLAGLDLDNCLDHSGDPKTWARGVIERFSDTYSETSPSGAGIKIWCRGTLPANLAGTVAGDGQIELYDHSRFFTVTGRVFRGAPLQVEDHAADLIALYEGLTRGRKHRPLQPLEGGRIRYGQQHNTLVSIAGALRRWRVCDSAIAACLLEVNARQCERPGPEQDILRIVRSTRRWGAA